MIDKIFTEESSLAEFSRKPELKDHLSANKFIAKIALEDLSRPLDVGIAQRLRDELTDYIEEQKKLSAQQGEHNG